MEIGEVGRRAPERHAAQQDIGIIFVSDRTSAIDVQKSVDAAEKQSSRVGTSVIGVVAELADLHAAAIIIGMRRYGRGIVLYKALVGAEPQTAVGVLAYAVDHVVQQPLLATHITRFDHLSAVETQ